MLWIGPRTIVMTRNLHRDAVERRNAVHVSDAWRVADENGECAGRQPVRSFVDRKPGENLALHGEREPFDKLLHPGPRGDNGRVEPFTILTGHDLHAVCMRDHGRDDNAAAQLPAERLELSDHGRARGLWPGDPSLRVERRDVPVSADVTGVSWSDLVRFEQAHVE